MGFLSSVSVLLGVATLGIAGGASATNLIVNGNFALPYTGPEYQFNDVIPGWYSNTDDSIETGGSNNYGLPCADASCQNLEVNAYKLGSVSQTITGLTVGTAYNLNYLYGGRPSGGTQILDVSFGDALLRSNTGSLGYFTPNSFRVIATSTSETLTFASEVTNGVSDQGNDLTGVSLSVVPEPAIWAMMLVGFAGVGAMARRRTRAALAA
jgi:hypothetical protein